MTLRTQTVLVVDEDPLVRRAFRALLTREGYRSLQASSLSQALELVRGEAIDLVITDLEFDGHAVPEAALRLRQIRDLPVIAVCGNPKATGRAGARGITVLKKPAEVSDIRAAIAASLASRKKD